MCKIHIVLVFLNFECDSDQLNNSGKQKRRHSIGRKSAGRKCYNSVTNWRSKKQTNNSQNNIAKILQKGHKSKGVNLLQNSHVLVGERLCKIRNWHAKKTNRKSQVGGVKNKKRAILGP